MKSLFFIAIQNLKKKKGDGLVLFFLIMLASLLLYTSLSVFMGMNTVLDNAYDNARSADLLFMSNVEEEKIAGVMKEQTEVVEYEASECIFLMEVEYKKEGEKEASQAQFFFGKIEEDRKIGKLDGCEDIQAEYDSIVLPFYLKAAQGFEVGDTCYFTLGEKEYEFKVAGFVEDPLFATPLNISVYGVYISSDRYEDIVKENAALKEARYVQHKVRLKEGEDSFAFDNKLSPILTKEIPQLSETMNLGINWKTMKGGVAMMSQISMAILLVFSILLILIVLIVIRFSVHNYIEMNLKNVGILQAAGYTSVQLNISVILEMAIVTVLAEVIGILAGAAGSSVIGQFQGNMLGLSWQQTFHKEAAGVTAVVILLVVLGVAFLSGMIYRRISVLESLRGGIHTHNFKKNYFEFHKSKLPVSFILAGKNLMHEKAKNLSIFCIIMLLSFAACVGFGLYENFAGNSENLLKMVGSETGDIYISGDNLEDMGKELEDWQQVEEVLYYTSASLKLESEEENTSVTCDIWENPEQIHNEMIIEGRLPKYDNEIVVTTSIAQILNVEVGDVIYVTGQGERMDYIVCGIDQKINNMGLKVMLNRSGLNRLNGSSAIITLFVYVKDDVTYQEISEEILGEFPEASVTDSEKLVENTMNSVKLAIMAICFIFVSITIFVVAMVEVLLVKTKVIRERKNMGLNKAFGFTTGQLITQTIMMNLPVISAGAVIGVGLSYYLMEPLIVTCLSFCGIKKCDFTVDFIWMAVTVIGVIAVAIITSLLSSLKIRQIQPVQMLTEE